MEILKAILLGFLQGVTEFLPISSSGHLSVFQHFFGNVGGTSSLLFTVLLHMGTLIAVFVVYYKTIWGLIVEFFATIKDIFTGKFKWREMNENRRMLFMFVISCVPLLFLLIPVGDDRRIMGCPRLACRRQRYICRGRLLYCHCDILPHRLGGARRRSRRVRR